MFTPVLDNRASPLFSLCLLLVFLPLSFWLGSESQRELAETRRNALIAKREPRIRDNATYLARFVCGDKSLVGIQDDFSSQMSLTAMLTSAPERTHTVCVQRVVLLRNDLQAKTGWPDPYPAAGILPVTVTVTCDGETKIVKFLYAWAYRKNVEGDEGRPYVVDIRHKSLSGI